MASPIEDQRAEILRLIARLQSNSGWLTDGDVAIVRDGLARASEHTTDQRSASDGGNTTLAARSGEPRRGRSRLEKRRKDLSEIKKLRARLEAEPPKRTGDVTLKAIEGRLARMEERIFGKGDAVVPAALPPPDEVPGQTFGGIIQGDILSDMLQLVSGNAMSGVFSVKNGDSGIDLFCEEGKICHAEGDGLKGESAVFAAFAFDRGTYTFRETTELPKERTITSNTQFLILEALRKIDESHAG